MSSSHAWGAGGVGPVGAGQPGRRGVSAGLIGALLASAVVGLTTAASVLAATDASALPSGCAAVADSQTFSSTGQLQHFTVPAGVTSIDVTAAGASGGAGVSGGGRGAVLTVTDLPVSAGANLSVLVGGTGGAYPSGGAGGGGGSFVYTSPTLAGMLVAAGGGGGSGNDRAGLDASLSTSGGAGDQSGGAGGVNGNGGGAVTNSGGGGGVLTGGASANGVPGGSAIAAGGAGGAGYGAGGFGGGGAGSDLGGGGGGYSGGGAGGISISLGGGGGGGSFSVVSPTSTGFNSSGAGSVTITWAPPATVTFDPSGGTGVVPTSEQVSCGGQVSPPTTDPTRTGHTLAGWSSTSDGSSGLWNFTTGAVTGDLTLYAVWTGVTVSVPSVAQGGQFTATGTGFQPGEDVTATLHSSSVVLGTSTADSVGTVRFTSAVPSNFPTGAHTVTLTGQTSGRTASVPLTVTAAAVTPTTTTVPPSTTVTTVTVAPTAAAAAAVGGASTGTAASVAKALPLTGANVSGPLVAGAAAVAAGLVLVGASSSRRRGLHHRRR